MKKFNKVAIIGFMCLSMCTNTFAGFWGEDYTIFDEEYQVNIENGKRIYDTYQKYFNKLEALGNPVELIVSDHLQEVSDDELELMLIGACDDLFDTTYVDYEYIDMIVYEYGRRHNDYFTDENPMFGMPDLIANQKQRTYDNEYGYRMRFPQQSGENVYSVLDPGLVVELMDRFFEVAPIDNEPDTLDEELSVFLDQNTKASYYYISNHKDMYIKEIGDDDTLQIRFENYSRSRISSIRLESSNPDIIEAYEDYFKNTRNVNKWCKIASGDNYIEFHNMYNGSYKINKKLTDEIKRKERERQAMKQSFIQADIDYQKQLFGE